MESNLQQGGFYVGQASSGNKVIYNGRDVRIGKDGLFIIGFGRDAGPEQHYTLVDAKGQKKDITIRIKQRTYETQKITGVDEKYVTPPDSVLDRIRKDSERVKAARAFDTEGYDFFQGLSNPLKGPVTGVYGSQRFYNGQPRNPHFGVDIAAPEGTKVAAVGHGVVRMADPNLYFSGGTIIIDHGFGISSTYLHLSQVAVNVGDMVRRGEKIGHVGATGRVTGAHLDWRLNWFDVRLDPKLMLNE